MEQNAAKGREDYMKGVSMQSLVFPYRTQDHYRLVY